jgi:hypothetical protein
MDISWERDQACAVWRKQQIPSHWFILRQSLRIWENNFAVILRLYSNRSSLNSNDDKACFVFFRLWTPNKSSQNVEEIQKRKAGNSVL